VQSLVTNELLGRLHGGPREVGPVGKPFVIGPAGPLPGELFRTVRSARRCDPAIHDSAAARVPVVQ
jgi:hypothetical protein